MTDDRMLEQLERVLGIVAPPPQVLVVGAWALVLYQHLCGSSGLLLRTQDVDFAIDSAALPPQAWLDGLVPRLHSEGYREEIQGFYGQESTRFVFSNAEQYSVEFIARQPRERKGKFAALKRLGPRFLSRLSLLFVAPWRIDLPSGREVWTPNPLCFVLQKIEIREERQRQGTAQVEKDAGAIVQVALAFQEYEPRLEGLWKRLPPSYLPRASRLVEELQKLYLETPYPDLTSGLRALGEIVEPRSAVDALRAFLVAAGGEKR